jgi:outer membrane lipoprotein-sorting protein
MVAVGVSSSILADDSKEATAIIDKAVKALGGEEKLSKIKGMSWKSKGTFTFGENESHFTGKSTVSGADRLRTDFEGDFGGGVIVVNGDKGWRKIGDNKVAIEGDGLVSEKRNLIPATILPLKDKKYKLSIAAEETIDGKAAVGVKVAGPDKKDFTLYFDKQSGLPVRMVAMVEFMGMEFTQETNYSDYKEADGIKKAMKTTVKNNGQKFLSIELSDVKVLDKVDDKDFSEPGDA